MARRNTISVIALIVGAMVFVVLVQGIYVWKLYWSEFAVNSEEWAVRGQFGDTFGAVNAFFSGLAFLGVVYTIYLQRNELQLQRTELARSVEAQQLSHKALSEQVVLQERAARLSAISTLTTNYESDLASLARSDQAKQEEVSTLQKRLEGCQTRLADLQQLKKAFPGVDHRRNDDALRRMLTEQIAPLTTQITQLEDQISENQKRRDFTAEKHKRLITELEDMVYEAIEVTVGGAVGRSRGGGAKAQPMTPEA